MKHNQRNEDFKFQIEPIEFSKKTDRGLLQYCLGGTLYMPATQNVIDKLLVRQITELKSIPRES